SANKWTISCAQIETKEALDNLDEILKVDGLDMVLVGPNDLCVSLTNGAERDVRHKMVIEALDLVLGKCNQYGVISGVFANDIEYAKPLIEKAWNIVAVGTESGMLKSALSSTLSFLNRP
ncbi:MAG: aldolase/citrate lyase family protein, partial [Desulfobulbia bacterium]